jgi:hypothetical protein
MAIWLQGRETVDDNFFLQSKTGISNAPNTIAERKTDVDKQFISPVNNR